MKMLLSVDIGTTAIKVSLIDTDGRFINSKSAAYHTHSVNGLFEQNPEDWWAAFLEAVNELRTDFQQFPPEMVVLSGQMQDLICITNGKVIGNAILYSDTRAADEWSYIERELGDKYFGNVIKNPGGPACLSAKILWLKKHRPAYINPATVFLLGAHDYICWKLTGLKVTDYTNASTTGLLDFESNIWDSTILSISGITAENLPELVRADTVTGVITSDSAVRAGLTKGLPVVHGAGDAGSSTIGAGAGIIDNLSCYLGTSGWIAATTDSCVESEAGIFNLKHPDSEKVINIGAMVLTGGNVEWCVQNFFAGKDFNLFTGAAEKAQPGSRGVFYLPYLSGERSPFLAPEARGAFIGLTRGSGKPEMARAVLEGLCYSLRSIVSIMFEKQINGLRINLSGGGAENNLWAQILSSVLNSDVSVLSNAKESGVLGSVVIARKAMEMQDSFETPPAFIKVQRNFHPVLEDVSFYDSAYKIFMNLYPALKNTFNEIAMLNLK